MRSQFLCARVVCFAFLLGAVCVPTGRAAGFAVAEQGAAAIGLGGAFVARADDPSAVFFNPAGLGLVKDRQLSFGGSLKLGTVKFEGQLPFPGPLTEERETSFDALPTVAIVQPVGGSIVLGLGLHRPFAFSSEWANPTSSTGRHIAQQAALGSYMLSPAIAVRLADRLAVGGTVDLYASTLSHDRRLPGIDPYDFKVIDVAALSLKSQTQYAVGFSAGLLARTTSGLSLGLAYRYAPKLDFRGDATLSRIPTGRSELDARLATALPPQLLSFSSSIALPGILSGGLAYSRGDWVLSADAVLESWSRTDGAQLEFPGYSDLTRRLFSGFTDKTQYRVGIERRVSHLLTVRGGYCYAPTPQLQEQANPLFSDADRQVFSLGATWNRGRTRLDVAPGFVLFSERSTGGANPEGYNGTYSHFSVFLGLSLGVSF
jgi:long-chain fatty acid transport protein